MALSNWATLAFDETGQPCRGVLTGFDGGTTEIYKNWLYVRDLKMWTPGRFFEKPTIAEVINGNATISEFRIQATRYAEQEAIFAFVQCQCRRSSEVRWMAGIGCSGYTDPTLAMAEAAGVKIDDWDSVLRGTSGEQHVLYCYAGDDKETFVVPWSDQFEPQWIGVAAEVRAAFFAWLAELNTEEVGPPADWLLRCREHGGLQFNQGDMYFADHGLGKAAELMTPVGSPKPPLFAQLLKDQSDD